MRSLLLLLRLRALVASRLVRSHAFELLALWPLVAGGVLWALSRILPRLREPLAGVLGAAEGTPAIALLLALILAALLLPSTIRELFPRSGGVAFSAPLPVPAAAELHVSLVACWARTLPVLVALLLLGRFLATESAALGIQWWLSAWAALLLLGLWQIAAALVLVHWRLGKAGIAIVLLLGLAWVGGQGQVTGPWQLAPWILPGTLLSVFLRLSAGLEISPPGGLGLGWGLALVSLYVLALLLYLRWHRRDLERARSLNKAHSVGQWGARLASSPGRRGKILAQVRRDILLVLRRFSPAVLPVGLACLALLAATAWEVRSSPLDLYWRGRQALLGCLSAVLAATALTPFLLRHQFSRLWMEYTSGVERAEIWQAKLYLARCLALPVVLGGVLLLTTLPLGSPQARALLVLELLVASWMMASFLGSGVFETAEDPILGLLFSAFLAAAMGGFMVFYRSYWPLGVVAFVWVSSLMRDRAEERVKRMELGG